MSNATHRFVDAALGAAFWLGCLALMGWSTHADAACPGGSPCETIDVYRIQSWPTIQNDASGRPLISIQEANGADEKSMKTALAGVPSTSTALAIHYNVTRIADAPNDYCECNLENAGKGCPSNLPPQQLHQCTRICRRDGAAACPAAGFNVKADGGKWYAFPVGSMCGGPRNLWKKNAFGNAKANWCDWQENTRVIKSAACLAAELKAAPQTTLAALYANNVACPVIAEATLVYLP